MAEWLSRLALAFAMPCLVLALAMVLVLLPLPGRAGEVTVFAAASLTNAMTDVGKAYEAQSDDVVHFSFASSSTLARQIAEGAPAAIYLSANLKWMDYVAGTGRLVPGSRVQLLANQLVLVAPLDSSIDKVAITHGFALAGLLGDGRLAMGNPAHVPAGIYGKQALQALGVWGAVHGQVARSADVRAALALVALGEAPLGIVYRTDAEASDKVKVVGLFPPATHAPIIYPAALVRGAGDTPAARAFFAFLGSPAAARIFRHHGFVLAGESR